MIHMVLWLWLCIVHLIILQCEHTKHIYFINVKKDKVKNDKKI